MSRAVQISALLLASTGWASAGEFAAIIKVRQDHADGERMKVAPGSVIGIEAGSRTTLILENFKGTKEHPIVFMNVGGRVEVENSDRGFAIAINKCRFVRFTGTGDPKEKYGFRAQTHKEGMHAFSVCLSSDFEVDHVEISGAGFAGFNIKSEPSTDGSTNRDKFTMYNAVLHDNFVHDTKGEGFYVGHTFYNGWKDEKSGKVLLPHVIKGLRIYNNITHNTGCEGMQIGSAVEDVKIYNNHITKTGTTPFADHQNNGVQIGVGTTGEFYNNFIKDAPGTGLIFWGNGDNYVYNNVIVNAGGTGIYCMDKGLDSGVAYRFVNNTVVNSGGGGIWLNLEKVPRAVVLNNLIVAPGKGSAIARMGNVKLEEKNNLCLKTIEEAGFLDSAKDDYRLGPNSKARCAATPFTELKIAGDFADTPRPANGPWDVGAFQYVDPKAPPRTAAFQAARSGQDARAPLKLKDGALAAWDQKLLARLQDALTAGKRIRFTIVSQKKPFTLLQIEKGTYFILELDGGKLPVPFKMIELPEKCELARGLAQSDVAEDHALAAFYLLTLNKAEAATEHLQRAGAGAEEVKKAFE